jgi:alanine racemase
MATETDTDLVTRWAWMEVDLGAIRQNLHAFKEFTHAPTKLMAVVKADAYGHGAVPVAKAARAAGADAFAVATVDEAVELRKGGIHEPLLVLAQPPVTSIPLLVKHGIMPAVYDLEFLARLGEEASTSGIEARYHLAVDTGMDRIGVPWEGVCEFMRVAERLSGIRLDGTFTHFATADRVSDWDFTLQLNRFQKAVGALREAGINPGVVHCANTASIVLHPEAHFDMVRLGVGLYGLHPSDATRGKIELHPAMSIRARATRVVRPQVGEGVGYGMTYRVARPSVQIATLPLGYADGLSRRLSNRMEVLYGGTRWRQVGNICMDQCMIEVEPEVAHLRGHDAAPIEVGDEVTIVGKLGDEEITLDDLADMLGTINYEVACDFGMRLPKRYINAGSLFDER